MARARGGGGGTGYAVALVGLGALFLISTLLAILFYAQISQARLEAAQAEEALDELASPGERTDPQITGGVPAGRTVVGHLAEENRLLKSMISGSTNLTAEALEQRREDLGIELALFEEVNRLSMELESERESLEQARQEAERARQTAQAAQSELAELQTRFQELADSLKGQIGELESEFVAYRGATDQVEQDAIERLTQVRREKEQEIRDLQDQVDRLVSENAQLKSDLEELRGGAELNVTKLTSADGQIEALTAQADRVYINRGRKDQVLLGMRFEVFDRDELVKLDNFDDVRGKATIEVVSVDQNTSLARVVRLSRGELIEEGDQIVNLVYDPNTRFKFFVSGEFDIDRTGRATEEDAERIRQMIRDWGGGLADELTFDVDFLVLGERPPLPEPLPEGTIDPVLIARNVEARREYETYVELEGEAKQLNIPILNQNRFLALVGHYER